MGQKTRSNDKPLTRRDFLRATGGATAGVGLAAGGLLLSPGKAEAAKLPQKWDQEYDVVIIGSGFAGLAAALEAKKAGSSVAVLEKMVVPGGNSIINGGVVAAAGSPLQAKEGIKDSPELLYQDMLKAGLNLNHPELARIVAEKSNEVVQWTINDLGVKYHDKLVHMGGHSVPRAYSTHNQSGSAIVRQQLAKLKEMGVEVKTKQMLTRLIKDQDGRVKGVEVREGYKFPDANSGTLKTIKAKKAVVMASGGFSNDIIFRGIQNPLLTKEVDSTNQPGATAEALLEALGIGATPVQISWIQLGPWTSPDEKGFGLAPHFVQGVSAIYGIWVDPATGKRFINELADRKIRADAILKIAHPCLAIGDSEAAKAGSRGDLIEKLMAKGVVKKFDSLDQLAAAYNMPAQVFKETVDKYNSYVAKGKDEELDKYLAKDLKPMAQPPFYVARIWPKVHHCMGGIQINTKAQVIGLDHQPIKGLFAAGEVSGGVHGAVRLGSCAVVDCLVFGRIAGQSAAAEQPWA